MKYRIIYQNSNIDAPPGEFDIGRSLDCNLVLDDPSVSRVHATILRENDRLFLIDRGSRNGCTLNGNRVSGRVNLGDGDIIKIGHQIIKIATQSTRRDASSAAKNTMGLMACANCGSWTSIGNNHCPNCGAPSNATEQQTIAVPDLTTPQNLDISPSSSSPAEPTNQTVQSEQMLIGLASKALNSQKFADSHRFISSFFELAIKKNQAGTSSRDKDLEGASKILIDLAAQQQEPALISELFRIFNVLRSLIPRNSVEALYNTVRPVGYLSCPEMHRYLTTLGEISRNFSPGEKFIHRRIEGLVSLCS